MTLRSRLTRPEEQRALLRKYIEAAERSDIEALVALVHEDVLNTMPPHPVFIEGRDAMRSALLAAFGRDGMGDWRCIATAANRQLAAACYVRKPGATEFRMFAIDVLRFDGERIVEITTFFPGSGLGTFGLPAVLT